MKRSYKYIWGLLTVAPVLMIMIGLVCFIAFIFCMMPGKGAAPAPPPGPAIAEMVVFYALFLLGIFLGFLVHISYFIHLVRKEDMPKDMKTLWVVLFLVVNIIAMIVYWFMVVLPEPEPGTAIENPNPLPVKRIRRK